jgi:hypothetical protein
VEVEALRLKFQVGPSAEVGDALGGEVGVAKPWHAVRVLGWTFLWYSLYVCMYVCVCVCVCACVKRLCMCVLCVCKYV